MVNPYSAGTLTPQESAKLCLAHQRSAAERQRLQRSAPTAGQATSLLLWKKKGFNQFALAEAAKTLERAAKEGWPTSKIAEVLRVDIDEAQELSAAFDRARQIVDAEN